MAKQKLIAATISKYYTQILEAYWTIIGQVVAFVGGFVGIKVLTHIMQPQSYGELALGVSISGMLNLFLYSPLGSVVGRFYAVCKKENNLNLYSQVLSKLYSQLSVWLLIISIPIVFVIWYFFGMLWAALVGISIALGISNGIQNMPISYFNAMRDRKTVTLVQTADMILRMVCAIFFVSQLATTGPYALAGYFVGSLIIVVFLKLKNAYTLGATTSVNNDHMQASLLRTRFIQFGLPFVAFAGFSFVSQYADRWLLQGFQSAGAVGVYAVMYQIAAVPITFIMGIVNQLILPIVFMRAADINDRDLISSAQAILTNCVWGLILFSILMSYCLYLWGERLIALISNIEYTNSSGVLWIIFLAIAVFNIAQFMNTYGLIVNKPKIYFGPKLVQVIAFLIIGVPLVYYKGIFGVAVALLGSAVVYCIAVYLVNKKLNHNYYYT